MIDHKKIKETHDAIHQFSLQNEKEILQFKEQFLHKEKGIISRLFQALPTLSLEERKKYGIALNKLKQLAIDQYQKANKKQLAPKSNPSIDLSLPGRMHTIGKRHLLSEVCNEIISIFGRVGFNMARGQIIEDDFHNFVALGFPKDHPAREMQDTFYLDKKGDHLLRTHTSPVQIRIMSQNAPPIRTLSVGSVFRNEAISARTHSMFHQFEGFYLDKKVSFADLKAILYYFCKQFFGKRIKFRLRPSYFPFTEPSAEVDIACTLCQTGCRVCKYTRWLEIGGAGLIDPTVLKHCNIDPEQVSGYAFGMGIERLAMLRYRIDDIRHFLANDLRFLQQYIPVKPSVKRSIAQKKKKWSRV